MSKKSVRELIITIDAAIRITQQKKSIANAHHEEAQRAGRSLPDDLKEEFKEVIGSLCYYTIGLLLKATSDI